MGAILQFLRDADIGKIKNGNQIVALVACEVERRRGREYLISLF